MYDSYYRFSHIPFGLSPDIRFCFRHRSYERARAYMRYALHRGEGFVVVTGRPGMGKTTLIQDLLKDLSSPNSLVARIDNTQLDSDDLLRLVTYSFGMKARGLDKATLIHNLRDFLLGHVAPEGTAILIVDEAQNLSAKALEELRLITNLQHGAKPLVQIFLVGQEGLRDLLRDPSLEQLHQRVLAACHLEPLDLDETRAYIQHRLLLAGWSGDPEIKAHALRLVFAASGGIPRLINKFCDRILLHGSLAERHSITAEDAQVVIREFREELLDMFGNEGMDAMRPDLAGAESPPLEDLVLRHPVPPPAQIQRPEAGSPSDQIVEPTFANPVGRPNPHEKLAWSGNGEPAKTDISAGPAPTLNASPTYALSSAATEVVEKASSAGAAGENADEPSARSHSAEPPTGAVGSAPDTRSRPVENRAIRSPANLAPASFIERSRGGNPQTDDPTGHKADQARGRQWAFAAAATLLLAVGGLGHLLYSQGAGRLATDVSGADRRLLAEQEPAPATGVPVTITPAIAIAEPKTETQTAQPVRQPDAPRTVQVPDTLRPMSPESKVSATAAEPSAPLPAPKTERGALQAATPEAGHAGMLPVADADKQLLIANFELPGQQDAKPSPPSDDARNAKESHTDLTVFIEDESGAPVTGLIAAEQHVRENADADESTASGTAETEMEMLRNKLRSRGYRVTEHEDTGFSLNLWEEIPFAFDSAEVPLQAYEPLQEIADILGRNGNTNVKIIGYTDDKGPLQYNKRLSLRRAQAVEAFLHGEGFPKERLFSEGRGEEAGSTGDGNESLTSTGSHVRRTEILVQPLARNP